MYFNNAYCLYQQKLIYQFQLVSVCMSSIVYMMCDKQMLLAFVFYRHLKLCYKFMYFHLIYANGEKKYVK